MTYVTIRCPHCKKVLDKLISSHVGLSNPFFQCSHCGENYVSRYMKEWENMTNYVRFGNTLTQTIRNIFFGLIQYFSFGNNLSGIFERFVFINNTLNNFSPIRGRLS
jgi:phage FluMu protein Com